MITNLPRPEVFKKLAIENIAFALDIIIEKILGIEYYYEQVVSQTDDELEAEFQEAKIHYLEKLEILRRTSLILLFQGIENYLKYKICEQSPFLLLSTRPEEWKNKNFNDLLIHQFDNLLAIFLEQRRKRIGKNEREILKELKKRRNEITHGVPQNNITTKYIFETLHTFIIELWDKNEWWEEYKKERSGGLSYYPDEVGEEFIYHSDLLVFKENLTKKKFDELFRFNNFKDENLYCPDCVYELCNNNIITSTQETGKYAYYVSEDKISCPVCKNIFEVTKNGLPDKCCDQQAYIADVDYCLSCGADTY